MSRWTWFSGAAAVAVAVIIVGGLAGGERATEPMPPPPAIQLSPESAAGRVAAPARTGTADRDGMGEGISIRDDVRIELIDSREHARPGPQD